MFARFFKGHFELSSVGLVNCARNCKKLNLKKKMIRCHFSNRNSLYKYFFFHFSIIKNCPNTSVLRLNNDVVQDILYEWGFLKRKKEYY